MNKRLAELCPNHDRMIRGVIGKLNSQEKEDLLNHVRWCPYCRPKFQVLTQLQTELKDRTEAFEGIGLSKQEARELRKTARERLRELSAGPSAFPARRLAWGVSIAVGALLMILGYFIFVHSPSSDHAFRGSPSAALQLLKPEGKLTDAPALFLWTEVKGKDFFRFELIDDELNLLYSETLFTNQTRLPESVKQKLAKGKVYLWTVSACDDAGNNIASASKAFEIE